MICCNIILTLVFLNTVFPVYLLSWTFVSFFSFSSSIYFWNSSLLAVSIFSSAERNWSIASMTHTDYTQPLLASCCLIICFSGFWQVLLFVDFRTFTGTHRLLEGSVTSGGLTPVSANAPPDSAGSWLSELEHITAERARCGFTTKQTAVRLWKWLIVISYSLNFMLPSSPILGISWSILFCSSGEKN